MRFKDKHCPCSLCQRARLQGTFPLQRQKGVNLTEGDPPPPKSESMKTWYLKNMVCHRCVLAVQQLLDKLEIPARQVGLGEVLLEEIPSPEKKRQLEEELEALGFELIDQRKNRIIEKIKQIIIHLVHRENNALTQPLSQLISSQLHQEYSSLSQLFSQVEGTTIEKYYIAQKIERVKELLVYDELSLSEIADLLHYSSPAYLSNQFRQVTGLRPSHFRNIGRNKRKPLDKV